MLVRMAITLKNLQITNGREAVGSRLHCWWEYKLVKLLWETVEVPQETQTRISTWPSSPTTHCVSIQTKTNYIIHQGTRTPVLTAAQAWAPPTCLSTDKRTKIMWHEHAMEYLLSHEKE